MGKSFTNASTTALSKVFQHQQDMGTHHFQPGLPGDAIFCSLTHLGKKPNQNTRRPTGSGIDSTMPLVTLPREIIPVYVENI